MKHIIKMSTGRYIHDLNFYKMSIYNTTKTTRTNSVYELEWIPTTPKLPAGCYECSGGSPSGVEEAW